MSYYLGVPVGIGDSLGNYKIVARLGNGGMGAVYLAEHPVIGKRVAIKVIHKDLSASRDVIARFFQEARAVTSIGHEHIVEVHDFGQSQDGEYFYVMEHLEGDTLASVMAQQRQIEISRAANIARQIAGALGAAHERGIMHRDLKPDNVMLIERRGERDFVKLLDFGLAKFIEPGSGTALTAVGSVVGTPQYMSPEACQSQKAVDHRTDIYALGILLFQMVSGRLPFHSPDTATLLRMQVFDPPPLVRTFAPHVPAALERIIGTCLAKAPSQRFLSMRELAAALVPFAGNRQPVVSVPPPLSSAAAQTPPPGARTPQPSRVSSPPPPQAHEIISISASALESVHSAPRVRPLSVAPSGQGAAAGTALAGRSGRRRAAAGWLAFAVFACAGGGFYVLRRAELDRFERVEAASVAAAPAKPVHLLISTQPTGLEVRLGERALGRSPVRIALPAGGQIALTFSGGALPEGQVITRSVDATADQTLHLVISPDIGDG